MHNIKIELSKERKKVETNASEAKRSAGNYKMGHISINGFQITIENPKGSYRSGTDSNGNKWKVQMKNDYGYFTKTVGKDGDAIDVFIGNNFDSTKIFAVDQKINGKFDETKVMFCFTTSDEAKKAYLSNYQKDWKGFWKITETDIDTFKEWLYDGHRQYKPFFQYKEIKKELKENSNMEKKVISLTENELNNIIKESVSRILKEATLDQTPWEDGREADYHKDHIGYGKHYKPFFTSSYNFDKALDAATPEEYDEIMRDRDEILKTQGELAQSHHPQCTPFRSINKDDLSSYYTRDYQYDNEFDPDDKNNLPSVSARTNRQRFPQGELDESTIRRIVRESLLEAENGGWLVDDSEAMEAYAFAEEKMGKEEIDTAIIRAMSTHQLAEILAYIFRMYDFREWDEYKSNKDSDIAQ